MLLRSKLKLSDYGATGTAEPEILGATDDVIEAAYYIRHSNISPAYSSNSSQGNAFIIIIM